MHRLWFAAILGAVLGGCGLEDHPRSPRFLEHELPTTQITQGHSGEDKDPEVSPDGKDLYYVSSSHGLDTELFVKSIGSNTAVRVTSIPGSKRFPALNPVHLNILAFATNARGEWEIALLDLARGGSKVEYVSEPGTNSIHPSWSADGRLLAYSASDGQGSGEWRLKIRDFATGKTHHLEDIDGLLPHWAPQGHRIVFQRMKHRDGWIASLWTLEFEQGEVRNLTTLYSSDEWAAINPAWSPDGRHIVFATAGRNRARPGGLDHADNLWVIEADGTGPVRLTTSSAGDWMPTWSSDGRIYFVSDRSGGNRIWSLEARLLDSK
jgi:TolB protein